MRQKCVCYKTEVFLTVVKSDSSSIESSFCCGIAILGPNTSYFDYIACEFVHGSICRHVRLFVRIVLKEHKWSLSIRHECFALGLTTSTAHWPFISEPTRTLSTNSSKTFAPWRKRKLFQIFEFYNKSFRVQRHTNDAFCRCERQTELTVESKTLMRPASLALEVGEHPWIEISAWLPKPNKQPFAPADWTKCFPRPTANWKKHHCITNPNDKGKLYFEHNVELRSDRSKVSQNWKQREHRRVARTSSDCAPNVVWYLLPRMRKLHLETRGSQSWNQSSRMSGVELAELSKRGGGGNSARPSWCPPPPETQLRQLNLNNSTGLAQKQETAYFNVLMKSCDQTSKTFRRPWLDLQYIPKWWIST